MIKRTITSIAALVLLSVSMVHAYNIEVVGAYDNPLAIDEFVQDYCRQALGKVLTEVLSQKENAAGSFENKENANGMREEFKEKWISVNQALEIVTNGLPIRQISDEYARFEGFDIYSVTYKLGNLTPTIDWCFKKSEDGKRTFFKAFKVYELVYE